MQSAKFGVVLMIYYYIIQNKTATPKGGRLFA